MKFLYEAMDNTGLEVKDTIEAESETLAAEHIRSNGLFVTRIKKVEDTFRFADEVPAIDGLVIPWHVVNGAIIFIIGVIVGLALAQIGIGR
jgi:hypothetical protein